MLFVLNWAVSGFTAVDVDVDEGEWSMVVVDEGGFYRS